MSVGMLHSLFNDVNLARIIFERCLYMKDFKCILTFEVSKVHRNLCSPYSTWYVVFYWLPRIFQTYKAWECESRSGPFTFLVFCMTWDLESAVCPVNNIKLQSVSGMSGNLRKWLDYILKSQKHNYIDLEAMPCMTAPPIIRYKSIWLPLQTC